MSYATDEEQLEALKRWWRENGRAIIAGVVLALVGVLGWQQWNGYQERQAEAASNEYALLLDEIRSEDGYEAALARGQKLVDKYSGTPYATLAALRLAQYQVERGEFDAAAVQLRWAVQNGHNDSLRHIARLRLGRLLLGQQDYQAALDAVRTGDEGAFRSQYQELRGDIYAARGERDAAVRAYQAALAASENGGQRRVLIQLKLVDLGVDVGEPVS